MKMSNHLPKIKRLLDSIIQMAEDESLSGSLSGGAEAAVRRYNAIVEVLDDEGIVPDDLFPELPKDTSFGNLGVEAKLLRSYLDDDEDSKNKEKGKGGFGASIGFLAGIAPFAPREDLSAAVKDLMDQGAEVNFGLITALAPFLGKEEVGRLLRAQAAKMGAPPAPPAPPEPPEPPTFDLEEIEEPTLVHVHLPVTPVMPIAPEPPVEPDVRLAKAGGTELQSLGAELLNPDLTPQRQAEVIAALTKLAHQQAISAEFPDER